MPSGAVRCRPAQEGRRRGAGGEKGASHSATMKNGTPMWESRLKIDLDVWIGPGPIAYKRIRLLLADGYLIPFPDLDSRVTLYPSASSGKENLCNTEISGCHEVASALGSADYNLTTPPAPPQAVHGGRPDTLNPLPDRNQAVQSLVHQGFFPEVAMSEQRSGLISLQIRPALLSVLKAGYSRAFLTRDICAGLTVGVVALPLAMAFAIASGATPESGLFTAIVAGAIISLLGGSRYQIGGPTGAFVVIIAGVIARHGYEGLVVATLMAGFFLMLMGFFRLGKVLQFIPYPVTTGFTAGIGLYILVSQFKDFLGLQIGAQSPEFLEKLHSCWQGIGTMQHGAVITGGVTIGAMVLVRRFCPRIPAHIVGILSSMLVVWLAGLEVETIGSRFGGIPAALPSFAMPHDFFGLAAKVLPDAFAIALLAGIESLLSAVVADGMTGERHEPSTELVAQGLANIASGLFGGIPATGAIARTATNIRAGAASPVAGIIHAVTLAVFMLFLAPVASLIPLASLAGVLCIVAWDMSEIHKFARLLRAPRSDVLVLVTTFLLTVLVDLTVAVQVGVVLAALLFMRRMSEVSNLRLGVAGNGNGELSNDSRIACANSEYCPGEVMIYEVDGPFFFGIAERFLSVLHVLREPPKVIVIRMDHVPTVDATGIHALETFVVHAGRMNIQLVVCGLQPRVRFVLEKLGTLNKLGEGNVLETLPEAMQRADNLALSAG